MSELQQIKPNAIKRQKTKASTKPCLLRAENIFLRYGDKLVLDDVSLTVFPNQILTLIGPNGAGKSSLIKIMLGIIKPSSGRIKKKSSLKVSYLAQKITSTDSLPLTVKRLLDLSGETLDAEQKSVLAQVGIENLFSVDFHSLSGGEAQKVLLARCLLRKPDLLILDEPTKGLDFSAGISFYHLLRSIQKNYKCSILIISHDLHLVMSATDKVICLNHHICCSGKPEKIQSNPFYKKMFSGVGELAFYTHHHNHCPCHNKDSRV